MTTSIQNGVNKVNCRVLCVNKQITLTSPSGRSVSASYDAVREADVGLFRRLTTGWENEERSIDLYPNDMRKVMEAAGNEVKGKEVEVINVEEMPGMDASHRQMPDNSPKARIAAESVEKVADVVRKARAAGQEQSYNAGTSGYEWATKSPLSDHADSTPEDVRMERDIHLLQQRVKRLGNDYYLVEYDVPKDLDTLYSDGEEVYPWERAPNRLWRLGWRHTWSCFTVPAESLNSGTMKEMSAAATDLRARIAGAGLQGVMRFRFRIIRAHADEAQQLREIGMEQLRDYLREKHTSLIERIGGASDRLAEATAELYSQEEEEGRVLTITDFEKLEGTAHNNERSAIRDAAEALSIAIECAERFDESEEILDLIDALREAVKAELAAHNARAAVRKKRPMVVEV